MVFLAGSKPCQASWSNIQVRTTVTPSAAMSAISLSMAALSMYCVSVSPEPLPKVKRS